MAFNVFAVEIDSKANVEWAENSYWQSEWPNTDFSNASLDLREILSGGVPKDGIRSVDDPQFMPVANEQEIAETEPVITVLINGEGRAYPLRYLMFHEIVNDTFEGMPISVTFCPLCNSSVVFERVLNGKTVEFGTTGKLHNSDLVMYDRLTETWWQQYNGTGIVGELMGEKLKVVASRLESLHLFKLRFPEGDIMVPPARLLGRYGQNPYDRYDSSISPFLYTGDYDGKIPALARVVVVGDVAYSLEYLSQINLLDVGDMRITWQAGQNSALDNRTISRGKDVGNIVVQKMQDGDWSDVPYMVSFAFAYKAFNPDMVIITE
ncbi:MAG: DUF3179 domain-containing protein [Alphaproteobacteria bacterium]|nr:DUF3179 domain-containing protein [Alphaproteobacteria bacterium]